MLLIVVTSEVKRHFMTTSPDRNCELAAPDHVDQYSPFCTANWYDSRRVVVVRVAGITHEAVEGWIDCNVAIRRAWSASAPLLIMTIPDNTRDSYQLSPEIRHAIQDILRVRPDISLWHAIITLSDTLYGRTIQLGMRYFTVQYPKTRTRMFSCALDGMQWLRSAYAEPSITHFSD